MVAKRPEHLMTLGDAAAELGTHYGVISGVVKLLGIKTKRIPYCSNGKGLNAEDMAILRKALRRDQAQPAESMTA